MRGKSRKNLRLRKNLSVLFPRLFKKLKIIAKKEKKHVSRTKKLQELSESESSEEEVIVKKRSSKKKIIYVDDDDSVEKHKPIINIYNNGKAQADKDDVIPIRKARGVFL